MIPATPLSCSDRFARPENNAEIGAEDIEGNIPVKHLTLQP
ncbi:hypothetical protein [Nitrosomonas aestuarii]|nr:hypothetical protein [Nitrosomonas aestuarii]